MKNYKLVWRNENSQELDLNYGNTKIKTEFDDLKDAYNAFKKQETVLMLVNLNIKDFAIVEHLNLEFEDGMISLTGETGAGKSILLGAISIIAGGKSNKKTIRNGAEKALISATFDITNLPKVKKFLDENDYTGDDNNECIIRRVIKKDGFGKSSAYIYDTLVSLSKVKELGEYLIEIHGQNQSQSLSKDKKQLDLLDGFSN